MSEKTRIPCWLDMSCHRVESIRLSRGIALDNVICWTDVVLTTEDGLELTIHCHGIDNAYTPIIDETNKHETLVTPEELQDIEDAGGPVTALCAEGTNHAT